MSNRKQYIKYFYYASILICALQLLFFLLVPFGGVILIRDTITKGFYNTELFACVSSKGANQIFHIINSAIAVIYFASLFLCVATLTFIKLKIRKKYLFGIYSCLISIVILVIGILLKQFRC